MPALPTSLPPSLPPGPLANPLPRISPAQVHAALLARREIALVDVREEDPFAQAHPLFAVQLSAGRIELDAPWRLPRQGVLIAVYDAGEGLAAAAASRLLALGYNQVHLLADDAADAGGNGLADTVSNGPAGAGPNGLAAWRAAGGELFRDVNVPSKAFGELVEHHRQTPSLPAEQVKALLDSGADVVVLDVRRFDEYQTMCIPGGTSVPGAELVLRARAMAPDPRTRIIVNCAGRTRSIIGTQSLVNAGIPNPVAALRNGTIGWTLAGFALDHGQQRRFAATSAASAINAEQHRSARDAAQTLASRAGAHRLDAAGLAAWATDASRTLYRWDVRTPEEFAAGHLPGFGSAPGGQLVQETDVFAAVRGARIVLVDGGPDSDGVRAAITAHWLAQMGWEVGWLADADPARFTETGAWQPANTAWPDVATITPAQLAQGLADQLADDLAHEPAAGRTLLLDLSSSAQHVKAHIPGARWVLRAQLAQALPTLPTQPTLPTASRIVLTCANGDLAQFAAADLASLTRTPVLVLAGGTAAWAAQGRPLQAGEQQLASPRIDRYRRPYEGTDAPRAAMQAYLDWEFGLVDQLARDGTHGFQVLAAA